MMVYPQLNDCVQNKTSEVDIAVLHISALCKWDTLDHIIRKAFKVSADTFYYISNRLGS